MKVFSAANAGNRVRSPVPFKLHNGSLQVSRRCRSVRTNAGLFGFLGGSKGGSVKSNELVDNLLAAVSSDGFGRSQSSEEINDLITQLQQYRPRAPTKSSYFYGDFEVAYSTSSKFTGGPVLGSPPGKVLFGFQKPRQTLKPSGELVQSVEFRTLGILPGKRSQNGQLNVIDGNCYEVQLDVKGEEVRRQFEVLYLDERIRIAQFLSDDAPEPVYFIFKRVDAADSVGEVEDEEEPVPKLKPQKGTRKLERGGKSSPAVESQGNGQVATLTAALQEWQEKTKATTSQLRDKERESSSSRRGAEPAKASLRKLQTEMSDLNEQLAEAVQAAEAAEARYRQARAAVRESEQALR